jgi:hypothetical protein
MALITVTPTQTDIIVKVGEDTAGAQAARTAAEASAAVALAAAGPNYASTAAGLAATVVGETFAVDEGASIAVYSHDAGPTATLLRRFVKDLGVAGGSALVGFQQAGMGAVLRDLQAKARETISVKDFGAVGNGSTDDAAAIQAAVDYASTFSEGARVCFPAGQYRVNSSVVVTKGGVQLQGDGAPATWIVNGTTNAPAIDFGDGSNTYFRNAVRGMAFGQASGVAPVDGNCGLRVRKCGRFMMDGVQTFQFPAALHDGVIFDNVTESYVNAVGFQNAVNASWVMRNNTFGIFATNGNCSGSRVGMLFRSCQGMYFTNFDNFGNSEYAFDIGSDGSGDSRFFFFTNCIGDTSGIHNWRITELEIGQFNNCWGSTQLEPVTGPAGDGFFVSGSKCTDLSFNNCVAVGNNRHGLHLELAARVSITGCTFGANFIPTFAGGLGSGNGVGAGGGSGILVGALSSIVNITGGSARDNQRYGVEVASGASSVRINDLETRFNILGGVLNNANATTAECKVTNVAGFNPRGFISAPSVPASGTPVRNLTGVDVVVYLTGGTLTGAVQIGDHGVLAVTDSPYFLPAGETITLTYSAAPAWQWSGN